VLADEGCGFDIATTEELTAVRAHGVSPDRIIHTHPIKKPSEIADARAAGVRTFVVDNATELSKFAGAGPQVRVLVRLAYRSPHAKSDLSSKFGVGPFEAGHLLEQGLAQGTRIAGFSFHVGSQLDDPQRFGDALADTLTLMDHLEHSYSVRFDTLDIGGGFPVAYEKTVASIEAIAAVLRPMLEPRRRTLDIIAEPGRVLVAEAMTAVTSVVGIAERTDGRWYYLDDGVYGAYSNVVGEDAHPLMLAEKELSTIGRVTETHRPAADTHRWATLAGPTCDSADVIAREVLLPDLRPGDLVVSPAMGAYTVVTASQFNGRPAPRVAVMGAAPASGSMDAVAAPRAEGLRMRTGATAIIGFPAYAAATAQTVP
jgi:ornithine decarboxylase